VEQRFLAKDDNQVFDRSTSYDDRQLIGRHESQSRVIVFDEEIDIKDLRRFKKAGKKWVQESLSGCFEGMDGCRSRRRFYLSTRIFLCDTWQCADLSSFF
jgi:hypothetical protein